MYQIIDKRGTGKTLRLMLIAKEIGAVIVCANPKALKTKAEAYGLTGIDFISYGDFIREVDITKKYLIDEVDYFIRHISLGRVMGYNLSKED